MYREKENVVKKFVSISEINPTEVDRISTCIPELDWLYGVSKFGEAISFSYWGLPVGKISVWQAEKGTGKSRLAIDVARLKVANGSTVLYFQNEVDLPTFASWVKGNSELKNFFCSEATKLADQIEVINDLSPQIVIVDSINLIEEYATGRDADVRKVIEAFRAVIKITKSHVIFLCQVNKDGSAKGSSSLGHMPDILLDLTKVDNDFKVAIGDKHRYGRTGSEFFGIWKHTDSGVECISTNRLDDLKWCKTTGQSKPVQFVSLPPIPTASSSTPIIQYKQYKPMAQHIPITKGVRAALKTMRKYEKRQEKIEEKENRPDYLIPWWKFWWWKNFW